MKKIVKTMTPSKCFKACYTLQLSQKMSQISAKILKNLEMEKDNKKNIFCIENLFLVGEHVLQTLEVLPQ